MSKPDSSLLDDVVAPKVLEAMELASEVLALANVRHVVVGWPSERMVSATKVADFLVGSEGFHHHANGIVTMRPEVPFQVHGVAVDLLSPDEGEEFLEATLSAQPGAIMDASRSCT